VRAVTRLAPRCADANGMLAHACRVAAVALCLATSSAAAEREFPPQSRSEAPARDEETAAPRRRIPMPELRWGVPVSPFPALEAERHLFGFHLHFDFGGQARDDR
jgi:hypothetical protein